MSVKAQALCITRVCGKSHPRQFWAPKRLERMRTIKGSFGVDISPCWPHNSQTLNVFSLESYVVVYGVRSTTEHSIQIFHGQTGKKPSHHGQRHPCLNFDFGA